MHSQVSDTEAKKAQTPHEFFLVNLIFNHVLLFIATVSAPSLPGLVLIVPTLSLLIISYTFWQSRRAFNNETAFVSCHWDIAARRSLVFGVMWGIAAVVVLLLLITTNGHPRPQHYALGGLAFLPMMITMLVLIILESEALQQARHRTLPEKARQGCLIRRAGASELSN